MLNLWPALKCMYLLSKIIIVDSNVIPRTGCRYAAFSVLYHHVFPFWSLHYLKDLKHTIFSPPFQSASRVINPLMKKPFLLTPSLMSYKDFLFLFQSLYLRMRLLQWTFPSTFGITVVSTCLSIRQLMLIGCHMNLLLKLNIHNGLEINATCTTIHLFATVWVHRIKPLSCKPHRVRLCYWLSLLFLFSINKICATHHTDDSMMWRFGQFCHTILAWQFHVTKRTKCFWNRYTCSKLYCIIIFS